MNSSFFARCIILITSILLVSSCATTTEKTEVIQPEGTKSPQISEANFLKLLKAAQLLQDNQDWQSAFGAWKNIAENSQPEQQALYANNAAYMLFKIEQFGVIPQFYDSLTYSFSQQQEMHKKILLAASYFNAGKTYQSLSTLPDVGNIIEPTYITIALNIRAQAILNIGKPLDSVKIRLQLIPLLTDQDELDENIKALWNSMSRISDSSIIKTLKKPQERDLRGWLELSLIARRSNMLPAKIEPWLEQWHVVYPDHSASLFAIQLLEDSKNIYINPSKIALMLPLEGKLSKVSNAILDGFLYAHFQSLATSPDNQTLEIEIIPIDSIISFKAQYNTAIQNGADFIVGPLNKNSVAELATQSMIKVPTLALNYDSSNIGTQNLFQFGLKPEDEAAQVADYALLDNKYNAATLMPNTDWGTRLNSAFKERYERLGGSVLSESRYQAKSNDYGFAIKKMLNLTQSKQRHSIIQTVIGEKAEFQPRRRKDIDMIFIGANARQARIIKPQLKFHYAQDIQVYATSHIANSNAKKSADRDRDLNGVYYVDMPWTLKSQEYVETKDTSNYWPTLNKSHGKLFALGIDTYRLIPQLKRLMLNPEESMQGLTGNLSIDEQGRVHRQLLLATYKKGKQVEITNEINQ